MESGKQNTDTFSSIKTLRIENRYTCTLDLLAIHRINTFLIYIYIYIYRYIYIYIYIYVAYMCVWY